jgi:hypothetical protein
LIYWNGPQGFSVNRLTRLPGLGPHGMTARDRGNAYTRQPEESYFSEPFELHGQIVDRLHWVAEVPSDTELQFQLRGAATVEQLGRADWLGPEGPSSYYTCSGESVHRLPRAARWLQYRAKFVSAYGCRSPRLREVRMELKPL